MRNVPRCAACDGEDAKVISLHSPAGEYYCGRACLEEGQRSFIRWVLRNNVEVTS